MVLEYADEMNVYLLENFTQRIGGNQRGFDFNTARIEIQCFAGHLLSRLARMPWLGDQGQFTK